MEEGTFGVLGADPGLGVGGRVWVVAFAAEGVF